MYENLFTVSYNDRDLICTEQERRIHELIVSVLYESGFDVSMIELVRKSDNYVSTCMRSSGEYSDLLDVARIKFTNRAKWIKLHPDFKKTNIKVPEDVLKYRDAIIDGYRFNAAYL